MLTYFDYVFYKLSKLYSQKSPSSGPIGGLVVAAFLQCCLVMSIFFLIEIINREKYHVSKLIFLGVFVLIIILNGIRYNKVTYPDLDERWKNEDSGKKARKQMLVLLYIFVSFFSAVCLAIYVGGRQNW